MPTARLELESWFSWRDVPYFMYKRSEATCHGTETIYPSKARVPNTGLTYIKLMIVESHACSSRRYL